MALLKAPLRGLQINKQGFTLLEILLVVAAITILAGVVIVALNPGKQLGDVSNAQRRADLNTLLNAVYQYSLDHTGQFPESITSIETEICYQTPCVGRVDLSVLTDGAEYLVDIPRDPGVADESSSGYTILKDLNGRITVSAPNADNEEEITFTK